MDSRDVEQVARARLAYVSAGRPPLCAPRHALLEEEEAAADVADELLSPHPGAGPAPAAAVQRLSVALPVPRRLTRQHLIVVAVLLLCAVGVAVAAMTRSAATEIPAVEPAAAVVASAAPSPSPTPMVRVHVAGEVVSPGVVTVPGGSIVQEAIAAAGGLGPDADAAELNLAAPVNDGMQIIIGSSAEPLGEVRGAAAQAGGEAAGSPLDLNTATAAALEELPGIGPVTARSIIAWREENGPFTSVDELQEVSGIGPATLEKLRPYVTA